MRLTKQQQAIILLPKIKTAPTPMPAKRHRHLLLTLLITLVTGIVIPLLRGHAIWWWLVIIGLLLGFCDWRYPHLSQPFWALIEKLGKTLAGATNLLVMTLIYVGIFIPLGLLLNAKQRCNDRLARQAASYYCPVTLERDSSHMERPF